MNSKELDSRLEKAFSNISPDVLSSVLADAGQQKGKIIDVKSVSAKRRPAYKRLMQTAAVLLLCIMCIGGFGVYTSASAEYASLTIDAADSFDLGLNKNGKIIRIDSPSEEVLSLMEEKGIRGMEIHRAAGPISSLLIDAQLISPESNSVLISVEGGNSEEALSLENELNEQLHVSLGELGLEASVMGQVLDGSEELSAMSSELGISPGKARLVSSIAASSGSAAAEALADMSVNELNIIIGCTGRGPEDLNILGNASMGLYLGEDSARISAEAVSGLNEDNLKSSEISLDYDNGTLYYSVSLSSDIYSFSCKVDALSGQISEVCRKYSPELENWYNSQNSELREIIDENIDDLESLLRRSAEELEAMLMHPDTGNKAVDEIIPGLVSELLNILSF